MKISSRVKRSLDRQFALLDELTDRAARLLLVELLNLADEPKRIEAVRQRLKRAGITSVDTLEDSELLQLRLVLRAAWGARDKRLFLQTMRGLMENVSLDHTLPSSELRQIWVLEWGERRPGSQDWFISWHDGLIRPLPDANFRGTVAWGFLRLSEEIVYCQNPSCPAPFYLRRRRDQKYCTANDECARFAGREAARRYWHSKGQPKTKTGKKGIVK
jgi:hypothetical protein